MLHPNTLNYIVNDPEKALRAWRMSLTNAIRRGNDSEIEFILAVLVFVWAEQKIQTGTKITLLANKKEGWSAERAKVWAFDDDSDTLVVKVVKPVDEFDDGLREVTRDQFDIGW